jgi:hypothetical protein
MRHGSDVGATLAERAGGLVASRGIFPTKAMRWKADGPRVGCLAGHGTGKVRCDISSTPYRGYSTWGFMSLIRTTGHPGTDGMTPQATACKPLCLTS